MPPLRRRDLQLSSLSNPSTARRLVQGLTINVSLANSDKNLPSSLPATDELEIAFAVKEIELCSLLSPHGILVAFQQNRAPISIPYYCTNTVS